MYEIFTQQASINYGKIEFPFFDYIKRSYLDELTKIQNYYYNSIHDLKDNHILVKLINMLGGPLEYDSGEFINTLYTRSDYICKALKLTSEISTGNIFHNEFFNNSKEILIVSNEYFDPYYVEKNWMNIDSVKFILHPNIDLNLVPPYGKGNSLDNNLVIININPVLLALQYKCYCNRLNYSLDDKNFINSKYFISRVIIPKMLNTMIDITIFNRYKYLYNNQELTNDNIKNPFAVINYVDKLDKILLNYINIVNNKKMKYDQFLNTIPAINSNNLREALLLPDIANTRYIKWSLILSRIEIIDTIIFSLGIKSIANNTLEINNLRRLLRQLKNDDVFLSILPKDLYKELNERIDRIMSF